MNCSVTHAKLSRSRTGLFLEYIVMVGDVDWNYWPVLSQNHWVRVSYQIVFKNQAMLYIQYPIISGTWNVVLCLLFWDPAIQSGPAFWIMTCLKKSRIHLYITWHCKSMQYDVTGYQRGLWVLIVSFLHSCGRSLCTNLSHLHTTEDRAQWVQLSHSSDKQSNWRPN